MKPNILFLAATMNKDICKIVPSYSFFPPQRKEEIANREALSEKFFIVAVFRVHTHSSLSWVKSAQDST